MAQNNSGRSTGTSNSRNNTNRGPGRPANRSPRPSSGANSTRSRQSTRTDSRARMQEQQLQEEAEGAMFHEIWLIIFFAVMVLLFLCNFHLIGTVGDAISGFMFGVFGFLAYVAPIAIFIAVAFYYANRDSFVALRKLIAAVLLFFLVGVIFDMIGGIGVKMDSYDFKGLFTMCKEQRAGGGIISGSLAYLLQHSMGTVGLLLVLLLGIVVCGIVVSQRSLLDVLRQGGNTAKDRVERTRTAYLEQREYDRQQREQRRQEQLEGAEALQLEDKQGRSSTKAELAVVDDGETSVKDSAPRPTLMEELRARREEARLQREQDAAQAHEAALVRKQEAKERKLEEQRFKREAKENDAILKMDMSNQDRIRERLRSVEYTDDVHELNAPDAYEDSEGYLQDGYGEQYYNEQGYDAQGYNAAQAYDDVNGYGDVNQGTNGYEDNGEYEPSFRFEPIPVNSSHRVNVDYDYEEPMGDDVASASMNSVEEMAAPEEAMPDPYENQEATAAPARRFSATAPTSSDNDNVHELTSRSEAAGEMYQRTTGARTISSASAVSGLADSLSGDAGIHPKPQSSVNRAGTSASTSSHTSAPSSRPAAPVSKRKYQFPPLNLLKSGSGASGDSISQARATAKQLREVLETFGVSLRGDIEFCQGPTVTRYELTPDVGVKVSKIVGLSDDIKMYLAATDIRIEAPIPGKSAVGIEVPNKENVTVSLKDLLSDSQFKEHKSNLAFAVGKDIGGQTVVTDIAKMPHVLIAGATGSGKSVCINTLIMSLLYKASPEDVQMIMVDPKVVELSIYNGIPHLMIPVVTDPKKASAALKWGVKEMEDRYRKFADMNVRDLKGYNEKVQQYKGTEQEAEYHKLPQIVIIIDELADLMMVSPGEVEESICRLAQLARACGIHLVVATQRPSVDVITGLIKANMPSRIAFAVSSGIDSRTILDGVGAEKLLGKGDMLFYPQGYPKPARLQGAFVSDDEVGNVVDFLKNQRLGNVYAEEVLSKMDSIAVSSDASGKGGSSSDASDGKDELLAEAGRCVIKSQKASIGYLQRMLKIGFNRAARIMDTLSELGVVGPEQGTKAREILMTEEEFEVFLQENGY